MLASLLALLVIFVSLQAANTQHMNSPEAPCRHVVITVEMANCFAHARERADHDLNAFYEQVRTKLPDEFPYLKKQSVYGFNFVM
ncbi:MAG TPA: hypothetical protein VF126_17655 [Acidobacteriaceae bacterium]